MIPLSIARALLRHSPILLLDEATSALDVATERKVLKNIMQDTYPRTCIVTTHRPTVLNICTRVYAIREKKCEVLKDEEIEKLIEERQVARKERNFQRADEIRAELLEKGIVLEDTREGVKWKRA